MTINPSSLRLGACCFIQGPGKRTRTRWRRFDNIAFSVVRHHIASRHLDFDNGCNIIIYLCPGSSRLTSIAAIMRLLIAQMSRSADPKPRRQHPLLCVARAYHGQQSVSRNTRRCCCRGSRSSFLLQAGMRSSICTDAVFILHAKRPVKFRRLQITSVAFHHRSSPSFAALSGHSFKTCTS